MLLVIKIAKDVNKGVVHSIVIGNLAIRCAAFVFDFYDNAIFLSLAHCVGIDVTSKVIDGLGNRSTRECDFDRARHTFPHIRSQFGVFGTVSLINHNENAVAGIQNGECRNRSPLLQGAGFLRVFLVLILFRLAELMNHRNRDIACGILDEVFQPIDATGNVDSILHGLRGFEQLRLQVFSVHD